jgi:hypothetical protein
LQTGLK